MTKNQEELLSFSLMDKFVIPTVRVVFSFTKSINKRLFKGPKFVSDSFLAEHMDYGRFMMDPSLMIPNYKKFALERDLVIMELRLFVKSFVDSRFVYDQSSGGMMSSLAYPYEENGKYCIAFEFKTSNSKMNLAEFYEQVKNSSSEISVQKKYNLSASKQEITDNERKFINQGVQIYLEAPLNPVTGIWFRINLEQKGNFSILKETNDEEPYYSVKYMWRAKQGAESFLIYNK